MLPFNDVDLLTISAELEHPISPLDCRSLPNVFKRVKYLIEDKEVGLVVHHVTESSTKRPLTALDCSGFHQWPVGTFAKTFQGVVEKDVSEHARVVKRSSLGCPIGIP